MKKTVLLLKGEGVSSDDLRIPLESVGFEVLLRERETIVLSVAQEKQVDLVIVGSCGSDAHEELSVVKQIKAINSSLPIILVAKNGSKAHAVASFRAGVEDYIDYPCSTDEFIRSIKSRLPHEDRTSKVLKLCGPMIGESKPMREVSRFIRRVAETDSTVLITGETGTGKELVASLIHKRSRRSQLRRRTSG